MLLLFTTPSCHQCPRAKSWLEEQGVETTLIDASKPEGQQLARRYQLSAVPTIVQVDSEQKALQTISGLENILQTFSSSCSSPVSKK